MAVTNSTGYTFINTVLRKEINGSPITPDRFNNVLNIAYEEKLSDEYSKFEQNQKNSDFFRFLKKTETINPDVFGKYDLASLTYEYWHPTDVYYNNGSAYTLIDVVTDDEWGRRLSSYMELPTTTYPVCKVMDGDLQFYPLEQTYSSTNELANSGFTGTTDWVDTNTDGIADGWDVAFCTPNILQSTGEYGFDGRAQGAVFDLTTMGFYETTSALYKNKNYYFEFEYYIASGNETITMAIWVNTAVNVLDITPTIGARTRVSGTFYNSFDANPTGNFNIILTSTGAESTRLVYIDKVFVGELNEATDVTLNYLKKPNTPYYDWYYDANDRIQRLSAGETYTLQANETYINKTTGAVVTSGDVTSVTVEMEIPDDDKRGVFYSMLSKFGIPIDQIDATQYSMQMESKELAK